MNCAEILTPVAIFALYLVASAITALHVGRMLVRYYFQHKNESLRALVQGPTPDEFELKEYHGEERQR